MLLHHGASAQERVTQGRYAGGTLLHLACASGDFLSVAALIWWGAGADVNATTHNGETPLMAAVDAALEERIMRPEFERMVEYLVSRGADIGIKDIITG
ncbi:hypothetical protein F5X98DRAFT_352551 [Xylaria grammica]|nr:hypothetical protein F5X98DRAFT_352551 [Xylaria grammica]